MIVVNIDPQVFGDPLATATVARGFLLGVVLQNRALLRMKLVPPVYKAFLAGQVQFRNEPWAGKYEEFADALTCMKRGWADCDDLVPWRVAELQEQGIKAGIKIYWRESAERITYHVETRLPDGSVEDVAAYLGMVRKGVA